MVVVGYARFADVPRDVPPEFTPPTVEVQTEGPRTRRAPGQGSGTVIPSRVSVVHTRDAIHHVVRQVLTFEGSLVT
jgi:hypothetical protein